ncbi:NADP-dependent oxidoreductase domain-containing protein [Lophiotrema nucula]|uniref:NADP-dependent oxidoreductase domain-containing protein n=1 Tax=Lophiotrema nucula TaxID=690887 RepID=A0A6A5YHR6_9PLEO|nr:NADP-dependent oxidoreductase domain-containing protein [Lophiotrema nucula]
MRSPAPINPNIKLPVLQNGASMSNLIYSTALREKSLPISIEFALRAGYGGIDTACSRGLHDEVADGRALSSVLDAENGPERSSLWIQTKYVSPISQASPWPYRVEDEIRLQVFASVLRSCTDLSVSFLDCLFLSNPMSSIERSLEVWKAMEEIVYQGGVRYLGIGHPRIRVLVELQTRTTVKPQFVQIRYDLLNEDGGALRRFCKDNSVVVQVYGILWLQNRHLLQAEVVKALGDEMQISVETALFGLIIAEALDVGFILCIIDGARQKSHISENVSAVTLASELPQAMVHAFSRILQG